MLVNISSSDRGAYAFPPCQRTRFLNRRRIVALPVRNEADHIIPCLMALAAQGDFPPHKVVLWINNTTDDTARHAEALRGRLPFDLEIVETTYGEAEASAGRARRDAMAHAAQGAPVDALLFTTDGDGEVAPDWMARILDAFMTYEVEAVFGRALLLPGEASKIPLHLHLDEDAEQAYGTLLEQITLLLDPDPHDPWPRHMEHSGASIAVTREAWAQAGGIPLVPSGEDRQFHAALKQAGVSVRHAPDVVVYVSARVVGRAQGGMADTLARRLVVQDEYVDDALEPVSQRLLRVRRELLRRRAAAGGGSVTNFLSFVSSRPIRRVELPKHHQRAQRVLDFLSRSTDVFSFRAWYDAGGRYDMSRLAPQDRVPIAFHGRPQ